MPRQGLFESDKEFEQRAAKENLRETTGLSQGIFESDADYLSRASKEALKRSSGTSQGIFESDTSYAARALGTSTGLKQGLMESQTDFIHRAGIAEMENNTGLKQGVFESEEAFRKRALSAGPRASASHHASYTSVGSYAGTSSGSSPNVEELGSTVAPIYISGASGSGTGVGELAVGIIFMLIIGALGGITLYERILSGNIEAYVILASALLGGIISLFTAKGFEESIFKIFPFAAGMPWLYTMFVALEVKGFGFSWFFINLIFGAVRSSFYAVAPMLLSAIIVLPFRLLFFRKKGVSSDANK